MNRVMIALAVSVLTAGSALASDKGDIMAVLKQWISGETGTVATCADDAAVIDDIPPFEWHGPGACSRWQKDNDVYRRYRHDWEPSTAHHFWRPRVCSASDHIRCHTKG